MQLHFTAKLVSWYLQQRSRNQKKTDMIAISAAVFLILLIAGTITVKTVRHNTVYTAFYNIPEPVSKEITKQIQTVKPKNTKFKILDASKPLPENTVHKYDILITWKNAQSDRLAQKALTVPDTVYKLMPSAIAKAGTVDGRRCTVPLLLDHYELAFYRTYRNNAKLELPQTLPEFETYLSTIKQYAQYPLIAAGSDDQTLCAFVTALTEAMYGTEGYEKLINELQTSAALDGILAEPLAKIRQWQKDGLLHPMWYQAADRDIETFMNDHRLGILFMPLSEHRTKPLVLIKYYDSIQFPVNNIIKDHAVIAPVIEGMVFRSKTNEQTILEHLLFTDTQEKLSDASLLAPVSSRAEAHDRQADDVRYWAASCSGGPVPDAATAAFRDRNQVKLFADMIRKYLEK